jgi:hypothetical protein
LQKLIEISKEYDRLKLEYSKKEKLYFENNNVDDLVKEVQNGNLPKWKQIERDYEEVEYQFIRIAKEFGKENKFSNKELIKKLQCIKMMKIIEIGLIKLKEKKNRV